MFHDTYLVLKAVILFLNASEVAKDGIELLLFLLATFLRRFAILYQSKEEIRICHFGDLTDTFACIRQNIDVINC